MFLFRFIYKGTVEKLMKSYNSLSYWLRSVRSVTKFTSSAEIVGCVCQFKERKVGKSMGIPVIVHIVVNSRISGEGSGPVFRPSISTRVYVACVEKIASI